MNEIMVEGQVYTRDSKIQELELLLLQHLGLDDSKKLELTDMQFLTLKSWILAITEADFNPGTFSFVQKPLNDSADYDELPDGCPLKVVYARGKSASGESSIWHEPLPWPDGWEPNRISEYQAATVSFEKNGTTIVMTYHGKDVRFGKTSIQKFIDALKQALQSDQEVKVRLQGGYIKMRRELHEDGPVIAFNLSLTDPSHFSVTYIVDEEAKWMIEEIESLRNQK